MAQLAPVGTKWNYVWYGSGTWYMRPASVVYTISKDSILQGNNYSVISENPVELMAFSLDSNRLYQYLNGRHLIFDFNLKKGDTCYIDYLLNRNYLEPVFVTRKLKIDSILVDSLLGNRYYSSISNDSMKLKLYPLPIRKKSMVEFEQAPYTPMDFIRTTNSWTASDGGFILCSYEEPGKSQTFGSKFYCDTSRFTGISENNLKPFSIFPNPASGSFSIQFAEPVNEGLIQIYDLNGSLLIENKISDGMIKINENRELKNSVYLIVVQNQNQIFREKLILFAY